MTKRQQAIELVDDMLPGVYTEEDFAGLSPHFAPEFASLSLDNVYSALWIRPGLSRRDRSLVTLGLLIAQRATTELRHHFPIALRNGLTTAEIEEVIYHATGYAGFPAANTARAVAQDTLSEPVDDATQA